MKTTDIITILHCKAQNNKECKNCPSYQSCHSLEHGFDWEMTIAERLEQLLINLRTTQVQLLTIKQERDVWRKRYMKLQNSLKNIVHENELLDNLMN